jgi:hypothetical protein
MCVWFGRSTLDVTAINVGQTVRWDFTSDFSVVFGLPILYGLHLFCQDIPL